jgi:SAM-dependent methyltransferase
MKWSQRKERASRQRTALPMPPLAYRQWVGPIEDDRYDNPDGSLVYPDFAPERYASVFDFGCGCGRVARQLILQEPRPQRYVGVDVHPELIDWCQANLEPATQGFRFYHHDVFDKLVNDGEDKPEVLPFPVGDESVTLFESLSIFTHIVERQLAFYLREAARVLLPEGEMNASFLLFEKTEFPVLDSARNALYIDDSYPPSAVYYDREWLQQTLADVGLTVVRIAQIPETHGYQWRLVLGRSGDGISSVEIPRDELDRGLPRDISGQKLDVG